MKSKIFILHFLFLLLGLGCFFACSKSSEKQLNQHEVKVVNAIPYVVPSDSMDAPLVIPIDENRLKKTLASQVQTQATDTQIHPPGTPQIVVAGNHS